MGWNVPALPGVGTLATVANWATKVIDCLKYLKGQSGPITIEDNIVFPGAQTVDGRDVSADGALLDAHKDRHDPQTGADPLDCGTPVATSTLASAEGAADDLARSDHRHHIGDHGHTEHTNRNRTLPVIPFLSGSGAMEGSGYFYGYALNAGVENGYATFQIPIGFVSFVSVIVGIIPVTTGTFDWTVNAEQLDAGETIGTDTDTDTANGQAATDGQLLELDITNALNGLTLIEGDWVGVRFTLDVLNVTTIIRLLWLSVTLEMDE